MNRYLTKITLTKSIFLVIFLSTLSIFLVALPISAVNDFDSFKPYLHQASVGDVPKLQTYGEYQTQLFQGSGSYVYSIDVPSLDQQINPDYHSQRERVCGEPF